MDRIAIWTDLAWPSDWLQRGREGLRLMRFGVVFATALALLLLPQLIWMLLRSGEPSPFARWFLRSLAAAAGLRVEVSGELLRPRALIVSNHISWSDILVLGGVTRSLFVARGDVRDWPGFGFLARLGGTLFIDRTARLDVRKQTVLIGDGLSRGRVTLFPEGTTGSGAHVLPFRSALLAAASDRPLQPVALAYAPRTGGRWRKDQLAHFAWDGDKAFLPHVVQVIASGGARCRVTILPPVGPGDRKARTADARRMIRAALGQVQT